MKDPSLVTTLLNQLDDLQLAIERLGIWNAAPLQARLLLEMANIRRVVHRIEVIRETTFIPTVYGLAFFGTGLLTGGLLFPKSSHSASLYSLLVRFRSFSSSCCS